MSTRLSAFEPGGRPAAGLFLSAGNGELAPTSRSSPGTDATETSADAASAPIANAVVLVVVLVVLLVVLLRPTANVQLSDLRGTVRGQSPLGPAANVSKRLRFAIMRVSGIRT